MSARPRWARAPDEELLALRLRDLDLRLEDTPLRSRLAQLHAELRLRGLPLAPRAWLSTAWFTPQGVDGFAVPFWLAHPRLVALERAQMGHVEGESDADCLALMRHETGHVLLNAYGLQRRKAWRETFGPASAPYRSVYRPDPRSRACVQHLPAWYAQSHPVEDFCETFAEWLRLGRAWRARYARWPAARKLAYVEEEMERIAGNERARERLARERTEVLGTLRTTLGAHYEQRRRRYGSAARRPEDALLRALFARGARGERGSVTGRDWLAARRPWLVREVRRSRGRPAYAVEQVLREWVERAHELSLGRPVARSTEVARALGRATDALLAGERRPEFAR